MSEIPRLRHVLVLLALLVLPFRLFAAGDPPAPHSAPDFTLQDLDGKPFRLSELRGKPVILNFWATWCAPCRKEVPWLVELQNEYGKQGLEIVGVSVGGDEKGVRRFAEQMGINYRIVESDAQVTKDYDVWVLPTTVFVFPDGSILGRVQGGVSREWLVKNVRRLLAAPAPAASGKR